MNSIIKTAQGGTSPFDSIRSHRADGSEYWAGRELMKWLGYAKWENAEKAIKRAIISCTNQGHDITKHFPEVGKLSTQHNGKVLEIKDYELSRFGCYLVAQNADPEKEMVAMAQGYFAAKVREAEVIIPAQNDRLRELELEVQLERERNKRIDRQDSMLIMHGREVVLALNGQSDAIVREQVKVTEVINLSTGNTDVFLSADQLKTEVQRRTGQKLKSQKQFTDAIRKANRDDLLIPVTRQATSEYIHPDRLDEAIGVVYGRNRQKLIGE